MLKVGLLTSGGDCQGLNAAIRGVGKTLNTQCKKVEIYGFRYGYKGLAQGDFYLLKPQDFSGILTTGGTILGTSRFPFKQLDMPHPQYPSYLKAMIQTYKSLQLDALVILGGNGTHKTAHALSNAGLNIVTLPKTIDNDLWGTDMTFGFQSAVAVATKVIDDIHSTAESHGRVFIVEVMGHKVGWLPLTAGIAGGADIILIPEIPYRLEAICDVIKHRSKRQKPFSIIAMAEGAKSVEEAQMSKKEYKKYLEKQGDPAKAYQLARQLSPLIEQEVRVAVPGHAQRGGSPVPSDRILATRCGVQAAHLILKGQFGVMVGTKGDTLIEIPLSEVAGKTKAVPLDADLIHTARSLGLSLGE